MLLLDWVEIDVFSNMADSVNTSLGVHLFENLQALNVGSTLFRRLRVLYRLLHRIGLNLHALYFPQYLFFGTYYRTPRQQAFHLCLSLSIGLSRSYACLLVDGRLNVEIMHGSALFQATGHVQATLVSVLSGVV